MPGRSPTLVSTLAGACALAACHGSAPATTNAAGAAAAAPAAPAAQPIVTTVPFVGCAQDGQGGPQPAPTGSAKSVVMDPNAAAKLAWYSTGSNGVLGPRGWYCFGTYGSNGAAIYVAPQPVQSADVLTASTWAAGAGPAIEMAISTGDTSGRFTVAQAIQRVFPSHQAFAQKVIAEGLEPASQFPSGPFATDKTTTKSDTVVEYETPADTQGLGSIFSRLTPASTPIDGAAVLQGATPDLAFVAVRLTPDLAALTPLVVQQFEADSAAPAQGLAANTAGPSPAASQATAGPAAPDGQGGMPPPGAATAPIGVVRAFYNALSRGDGPTAAALVEPQKRSGNYSAEALSRYYGQMAQPLHLISIHETGPAMIEVRYVYMLAGGRACSGGADVRTADISGQTFIASIEPSNGC
jgi:hypothetical protein